MDKTTDFLPESKLKISQRKDMFRINTDTYALSSFMIIKKGETVVDIGTNNGALLIDAARFQPKMMIGVDIFAEAIDLAKENFIEHNIDNVELFVSRIQDLVINPVDVILCNPPYFNQMSKENRNPNPFLEAARHEIYLPLYQLLDCVKRDLKDHGRFYLIHRSDRLAEIIIEADKRGLALKRCMPILDHRKNNIHAICLEFVKGGKPGVIFNNPMEIGKEK
ncbi:MAG: methyltransferase [Firmicutes bacterium HGW-Firmicutes-20]|nr:MAG: methyltransferase [Firmicutes bacterium HGW-Firmicutes-20]PKM67046.1 MAG: methyltransferase [Firmicutes bacterium HGW-Firmicutes-19]